MNSYTSLPNLFVINENSASNGAVTSIPAAMLSYAPDMYGAPLILRSSTGQGNFEASYLPSWVPGDPVEVSYLSPPFDSMVKGVFGDIWFPYFGSASLTPKTTVDRQSEVQTGITKPHKEKSISPAIEVIAEWDGYVEDVQTDYFTARLTGLKGPGVAGKEEEAEIPLSDVDSSDLALVDEGAFFRLTISYELRKGQSKRRFTSVQFRRLPAYSARDIAAAKELADEIINGFQVGSGQQSTGY